MPIAINGSGSITGISVGGLPDGIVDADMLASGVGGKVLQVVQTTKTDVVSTTLTDSVFEDISGLSLSITPSATSSKVLVFFSIHAATTAGNYNLRTRLMRGSTAIGIGDQVGSNRARSTTQTWTNHSDSDNYQQLHAENTFLDSPNTTSATTYKLQWQDSYGRTVYLNRIISDSDSKYYATSLCHITAMEVAA